MHLDSWQRFLIMTPEASYRVVPEFDGKEFQRYKAEKTQYPFRYKFKTDYSVLDSFEPLGWDDNRDIIT